MLAFLKNFWVCLGVALFCSCQTVQHYERGEIEWAWVLGFFALLWLNDARKAMQREDSGEGKSSKG